VNPVEHLLSAAGLLAALPQASQQVLTGRQFFPELISGPFHQGLVIALSVSAALAALAGVASLLRGGRYIHQDADQPPQLAHSATARANPASTSTGPASTGPASTGRSATSPTAADTTEEKQ
jgi:hypothetical protein